ncbi:MAG: DsbC family protein [Alphaproteobacteria bacterium]|uniref:DsbC family protein n=1 Tax=Candidatus Nitrobium versatile TaxID=2884831 RepID=A0A953M1M7_9BACT|nr:DsbC family protein [Candidatus Nitrobium versatile]
MKRMFYAVVLFLLLTAPLFAEQVDTAKVKSFEVMKNFLEKTQTTITEVRDLGSLYEVALEQGKKKGLVYLTKDGKYIVVGGSLVDKDFMNITALRAEELNRVNFSEIPLNDALVIKKGSGAKKLVMITDVDCPFCRKAHEGLKTMTDYTLYVFFLPLPSHPNSHEKSVKVLCSKDPAAALDLAKSDKEISAEKCAAGEEKLKKHMDFVNSLGISSTPQFIIESGRRIEGANMPALEEYLKK